MFTQLFDKSSKEESAAGGCIESDDAIKKAKLLLSNKATKIISPPERETEITVIIPCFNARKFLIETLDSVFNQSLSSDLIQAIVVDDKSNDDSSDLLMAYADKHSNLTIVLLNENTGSPGTPRNIGIELSKSKYVTFLDADDYLHRDGLKKLYDILEESNDDYVVGKTIKKEEKRETIIGEWQSIKERRNISPLEVKHFFHHLGPTARMLKLSIVKENNIRFPELRFGEDKFFFASVLLYSKSVATTTDVIYFANRLEENNASLTRTTDVLQKRKADLQVLKLLNEIQMTIEQKKMIFNRIYEYDFVRTFNSQLFLKSTNKQEFFSILDQAIKTTENLEYNFVDEFESDLYKLAITLYLEGKKEQFIKLFEWNKHDKNKQFEITNGIAYGVLALENETIYVKQNMFARYYDSFYRENTFHIKFEIYGDYLSDLNYLLLRDKSKANNDKSFPISMTNNRAEVEVDLNELTNLDVSQYAVLVRYNDYQNFNVTKVGKNNIKYNKREYEFYTTVANNLGFSIRNN
ncbi:glycosyltransferase family 2 protein [Bacillaceae bacterium IKA-2]|nr:glycosyltransferase family 2 protein [Bacillaceae bacterium IKA-2]